MTKQLFRIVNMDNKIIVDNINGKTTANEIYF